MQDKQYSWSLLGLLQKAHDSGMNLIPNKGQHSYALIKKRHSLFKKYSAIVWSKIIKFLTSGKFKRTIISK